MRIAVETAKAWGRPPTWLWRHKKKWSRFDDLLALAYSMYERMVCAQCGHPLAVCRSGQVEFEAVESTCHAKAAIDRHEREQKGQPEPGVIVTARPDNSPTKYGGPPAGWND